MRKYEIIRYRQCFHVLKQGKGMANFVRGEIVFTISLDNEIVLQ